MKLLASYVFDWFIIIVIAAIGGGLNFVEAEHRPFSLLDLSISYPFVPQTISVTTLALVALFAPAVIITLVSLVFVPGPASRHLTRLQGNRRRLWEVYAGLTGLALSVAIGFFITQGLKNIFGKPRPHLIALCQPQLDKVASQVVGGYGQDISPRWTIVDSAICTQPNKARLNDGFRSFPSGHCSFSWSGLLYLSLFLSSKFSIAIPYLPQSMQDTTLSTSRSSNDTELLPLHNPQASSSSTGPKSPGPPMEDNQTPMGMPLYNQAAAPPNYGLLLVLIPLGVACYISSTRYVQFWHFGFDIVAGSLIGIGSAWFSFRWYHPPVRRGQGWAWGPRSQKHAFAIGIGVGSYVTT